jgi:hypothetical protein
MNKYFRRQKLIFKTHNFQGCQRVYVFVMMWQMHLNIDTPLHHISIGLAYVNLRSTLVKNTLMLPELSLWATKTEPVSIIVNLVVTKKFKCCTLWQSKEISITIGYGDPIFSITKPYNNWKLTLWWPKTISIITMYGNQIFQLPNLATTKKFQSRMLQWPKICGHPSLWWPELFNHHRTVIDSRMATKFFWLSSNTPPPSNGD